MEVRNKRLSDEEFLKERQEVLALWPTGKEVDLDEAVEYHKTLLPEKNYALKVAEAKKAGTPLIRIDSGVASLDKETTERKRPVIAQDDRFQHGARGGVQQTNVCRLARSRVAQHGNHFAVGPKHGAFDVTVCDAQAG